MHEDGIGLYIHMPFCRAKCHYCDFNSAAGKEHLWEAYFTALRKELDGARESIAGRGISTLFIGGGTPSVLPPQLIVGIMDKCRQLPGIKPDIEASIEANPGTIDFDKLSSYRRAGLNRLSFGLQSTHDTLLKLLGRIHSLYDFDTGYKLARKAGFDNINIDLIFGIPGQTAKQWKKTLEYAVSMNPEHISCYSLIIEEGTVFGDRYEAGKLKPVDEELDREMYWEAVRYLSKEGYTHYEISNFAREGYQCRHNLIYWKAEEYIGLGSGAHSYFNGMRYSNICSIEDYIGNTMSGSPTRIEHEHIGRQESMLEYMMLGLRLMQGVSMSGFQRRYGAGLPDVFSEKLDRLGRAGLITVVDGFVKLTEKGMDLANQVFMEFV